MRELLIRNRQRRWRVEVRQLRVAVNRLLDVELELQGWDLGIHLIGARRMAAANWRWLRHPGSTDVITFDHGECGPEERSPRAPIRGELLVCVDDAAAQAVAFRTTPGSEVVRYVVHGVLHLMGYDDLKAVQRRRMKREEDRLMRRLERLGSFGDLVMPGEALSQSAEACGIIRRVDRGKPASRRLAHGRRRSPE